MPSYSITSDCSMSRWLPLIIPLFRRRWMSSFKGVIEPSSGGACFYSSMFVVPKHTGGLWPILNLKQFNCYLHIPSFRMPTIRHVWQLIQHGDYAFSTDLQVAYLHIPIVKHHHNFLQFVWYNMPYHWKVLPFGMATGPRIFTALTKLILFLCHNKGFYIVIYLDNILVLIHSKWAGKRAHSFLCSLLVCLGLHINYSKSDLCLLRPFVSWDYAGILSACQYLYLLISWLTFTSLLFPCCRTNMLQSIGSCPF